MDEEYLIFADLDGMYPGNIIRTAQPVDWSSLLHASVHRQRQRQQQQKKKKTTSTSTSTSASTSASSISTHSTTVTSSSLPFPSSATHGHNKPEDTSQPSDQPLQKSVSDSLPVSPSLTSSLSVKIHTLLSEPTVRLDALKKLSWGGLPHEFRPHCWKLLLGYTPKTAARRHDTIERKRREYRESVAQHYVHGTGDDNHSSSNTLLNVNSDGNAGNPKSKMHGKQNVNVAHSRNTNSFTKSSSISTGKASISKQGLLHSSNQSDDDIMMRQIEVDIPRTSPGQRLFQIHQIQQSLQRILYVWAMRHPASGYVQGMNDLVTPFMYVFLTEYSDSSSSTSLSSSASSILDASDLQSIFGADESSGDQCLADAEADAYWCLTALLNSIQDYYTFSQPGIQRRVHFLRDLVSRVDAGLCAHLEQQGLDFLQFAFRWMNCLLMRELPFHLIIRVWDTYLAESDGFAVFHVYVCAALLVSFSDRLMEMEFQELVMFLQNLPTESWTEKNIDIILSQAYMWRTIFGQSPSHLQ